MEIFLKNMLPSIVTVVLLAPAMAYGSPHQRCGEEATVEVRQMGMVNQALLEAHVDKVKKLMSKLRHARGSHVSRTMELRKHLSDMRAAIQVLHDQMYAEGCEEARHGASVDVRVQVMETRVVVLEQMIEQMIEHLSEQAQ